jgi:hypothetical protein
MYGSEEPTRCLKPYPEDEGKNPDMPGGFPVWRRQQGQKPSRGKTPLC